MSRDTKFVLFLKRTNCTENPLCSQFSLYSLQWLYWGEGRGCSKFLNEWPQASRECCIFRQTGILDKTIRIATCYLVHFRQQQKKWLLFSAAKTEPPSSLLVRVHTVQYNSQDSLSFLPSNCFSHFQRT